MYKIDGKKQTFDFFFKHVPAIFMGLKTETNVPMIPMDSADANLELLALIATDVRMVIGVSERMMKLDVKVGFIT